jgi:hypothetical protein
VQECCEIGGCYKNQKDAMVLDTWAMKLEQKGSRPAELTWELQERALMSNVSVSDGGGDHQEGGENADRVADTCLKSVQEIVNCQGFETSVMNLNVSLAVSE